MKKLELLYGRRADAYREFLINAGTFAHDPWNEEKYVAYLSSYLTALTVASEEVEHALNGNTGISVHAQCLRTAHNYDEMIKVQIRALVRRNEKRD